MFMLQLNIDSFDQLIWFDWNLDPKQTWIPFKDETPMYKKTPYRTGMGIYWKNNTETILTTDGLNSLKKQIIPEIWRCAYTIQTHLKYVRHERRQANHDEDDDSSHSLFPGSQKMTKLRIEICNVCINLIWTMNLCTRGTNALDATHFFNKIFTPSSSSSSVISKTSTSLALSYGQTFVPY